MKAVCNCVTPWLLGYTERVIVRRVNPPCFIVQQDTALQNMHKNRDRLKALFSPQSVAVIGASNREDSVGGVIFSHLVRDYKGKIFPVNKSHASIQGRPAFASILDISEPVDLAVIATPADTVPGIVEECGRHGVKGVAVLAAGFSPGAGEHGQTRRTRLMAAAQRWDLRVIGPNCLGIMRPSIGLNALFLNLDVKPGIIALVSQSDALCAAVLDCAHANNIGFSSVVSLGASSDVDIAEILDFLASDSTTESIMLYLEGIYQARPFMSALSAASRMKPVIVLKAGRFASGSKTTVSHSGALVGTDAVFEAALRRAGAVRIHTLNQFFAAAKTLSARRQASGNHLAIVTNGNGPGLMAADRASMVGVELATLSAATQAALAEILPAHWQRTNPVDILGDADPDRYRAAVEACLRDPEIDGVLVILAPLRMTRPLEVARMVIDLANDYKKPLLACWMGDVHVEAARRAFVKAKVPSMRTPEAAVDAFSFIADYHRNQQLLLQTVGPLSTLQAPAIDDARRLIQGVLAEGRKVLTEVESKTLLAAFHIPVVPTAHARSEDQAVALAQQAGFPVAMKVYSPDVTHKSNAGGVRLNLASSQEVKSAFHDITATVLKHDPNAKIDGVAIQPMIQRPNGRELMVGIARDEVFGPVIAFGAGGTLVDFIGGHVMTLPPLNGFLIKSFISRSPVSRLLGTFRGQPGVHQEALENVLLRVSEIACELPWVKELDINPLIVDEHGVVAVDARIVVDHCPAAATPYSHMAIHPYPTHLVTQWHMPDGTEVVIRPIRPEDAIMEKEFVAQLSDESRYFRFLGALKELTPAMLLRFTQIDYDRELALVAVSGRNGGDGKEEEMGVARFVIRPDGKTCEFAVVVADRWQGHGLGNKLMVTLMDAARAKQLARIEGEVLASNYAMLALMEALGFSIAASRDDSSLKVVSKKL